MFKNNTVTTAIAKVPAVKNVSRLIKRLKAMIKVGRYTDSSAPYIWMPGMRQKNKQ